MTLRWIKSYLVIRKQRVVLDNYVSDWADASSGVPQGFVLGPTLFNIFINDLSKDLSSECEKYADDTKIFNVVTNKLEANSLHEDLNKITEWSNNG